MDDLFNESDNAALIAETIRTEAELEPDEDAFSPSPSRLALW